MNITTNYPTMVFKNEHNGSVYYQVGISKKMEDGTYENASILAQFRKGVEIEDKSKIVINKAFLSFYKKDKITNYKIVVLEFEKLASEIKEEKVEVDPFADFGKMVETDDNFLE